MRTGYRLPAARSTGEAGSAYIAVLLVLVVLTAFGLALSLITQTEMQVGSNERTVSRVFYAADSGVEAATAQVLVTKDFTPRTYMFTDTGIQMISGKAQFGTQVTLSDFQKVQESPCNLCEINQGGGYGGRDYSKTTYSVTATAARFATLTASRDDSVPLAQKSISAMIEMQPFERTVVDPEAEKK
ncbi:MAG TPA: PilX N-terminal domain-containing pilus assembly protein [Thermoanaerobaculia bacterium]